MGRLKSLGPRTPVLPPKVRLAPKIADPFYQSSAWLRLKRSVEVERGRGCEDVEDGERCWSTDRLTLDHIVERKDGGADLERSNVRQLCHAHHRTKTAKARGARARGET